MRTGQNVLALLDKHRFWYSVCSGEEHTHTHISHAQEGHHGNVPVHLIIPCSGFAEHIAVRNRDASNPIFVPPLSSACAVWLGMWKTLRRGCWTLILSELYCGGQTHRNRADPRRDAAMLSLKHLIWLHTLLYSALIDAKHLLGEGLSLGWWHLRAEENGISSTGEKAASVFKGHNNPRQISLKLWQPRGQNTFFECHGLYINCTVHTYGKHCQQLGEKSVL